MRIDADNRVARTLPLGVYSERQMEGPDRASTALRSVLLPETNAPR